MKTSLLLFCTVFVIENFVVADNNEFTISPVLKAVYYKKSKDRLMNGPKLLNRRLSKLKFGEPRTKKHVEDNGYTVFPTNVKKQAINVPSSPYFSGDTHVAEPKLRVKKVLPDFWNVHDRKKRSPEKAAAVAVTEKKEDKKVSSDAKATTTKIEVKKVNNANKPIAKSGQSQAKQVEVRKVEAEKDIRAPVMPAKVAKPKSNNTRRSKSGARSKKSKKPAAKRNKPPTRKSKGKSKAKRSHSSSKKSDKKTDKRSSNKKGKKDVETRRLIAGRDAMIENYPYVVSIQKDGEHWCAGALLNQRLVITTANCVWKSSRMSRMKIRAGSRHLEHGGQLVRIAEVLKHPGWSIRKNPDHDVALLLTDGFVKFSHSCHAVDLPNRVMMPIFDDAWVTSWGAERRDGVYVKQGLTLQVYHGRLLNRDKCNNVTMRFGVMVSENFICLEQVGRHAPCTRDTGAPAVSDGVLWGLASWGIRKMCGTERFPAMFSYIASQSNMDFIINGTTYLMSEERLSPFPDRYPFPRVLNASNTRI